MLFMNFYCSGYSQLPRMPLARHAVSIIRQTQSSLGCPLGFQHADPHPGAPLSFPSI